MLTVFVVRRAGGSYNVVILQKVFAGEDVRRTVMTKGGLRADQVGGEVERTLSTFDSSIAAATGIVIRWNTLDLSDMEGRNEQVRLIKEWGGVKVHRVGKEDGPTGFAA